MEVLQNNKDFYSILGLSKTSSLIEIKTRYLKLVEKYHPDNNSTDTLQEFNQITLAYKTLTKNKELYDSCLIANFTELKKTFQENDIIIDSKTNKEHQSKIKPNEQLDAFFNPIDYNNDMFKTSETGPIHISDKNEYEKIIKSLDLEIQTNVDKRSESFDNYEFNKNFDKTKYTDYTSTYLTPITDLNAYEKPSLSEIIHQNSLIIPDIIDSIKIENRDYLYYQDLDINSIQDKQEFSKAFNDSLLDKSEINKLDTLNGTF
jgi:curved DNA-binding protein CbpA